MKKKSNQEQLTVILPENFSADAILEPLGLRKDFHANIKAGMYFILDSLLKMSQNRKWRDYFDEYGGYPLHSSLINQIVGKNYTTVIDLMIKGGVIKRTKGYQTGKQSKLFTLTKKYASVHHKIRPIPKDASLYKRLLEYLEEQKKLNDAALAKIKYITKWFDPKRLTIDKKRANSLIEFYMAEAKSMIPDPLPTDRTLEEVNSRITLRVNSMIDTFKAVESGYMGLKKTGNDNRLHSVVSNTKKELRSLYRYDGKPMVSIDIKASQPYMLTQLLNPKSWGEKGLVSKVLPELYSRITSRKYKKLLDAILMFGVFSKNQPGKGFQKTGFYRFQWNTDFYQHLVDRAKAEGAQSVFPDRSSVKKKMMMILFDDGTYMEKDKGFMLFKKWFPEEANMVSLLKTISRDTKSTAANDEGLSFLPILLQRIESYLMLEKVCKRISKELPDAPLIPVHDCIMTTADYAERVSSIVNAVLKKETGLLPGVTIDTGVKKLTKSNIQDLAANDLSEVLEKKPKGHHAIAAVKPIIRADFDGDDYIWVLYMRGVSYDNYDPDGNNVHIDLGSV